MINRLILVMILASPLMAQQVIVQPACGASNSYLQGSIGCEATIYNGYNGAGRSTVGLGYGNGKILFGAVTQQRIADWIATAGAYDVMFALPSDFQNSAFIPLLGITGLHKTDDTDWLIGVGGVSQTIQLPFIYSNQKTTDAQGFVFYTHRFGEHWSVQSQNIVAAKLTSIESAQFKTATWTLAGSGGIGNNAPYISGLVGFKRTWTTATLSKSWGSDEFRLVPISTFFYNSNVGLNGIWTTRTKHFNSLVQRQNLVNVDRYLHTTKVTAESASAGLRFGIFNSCATVYQSSFMSRSSFGYNGCLGITTRRLNLSGTYYNSMYGHFFTESVSERINSRLQLIEYVNEQGSHRSISGGVNLTTDKLSVSITESMNYYPALQGRSPFQQSLNINISGRVPGTLVAINTNVSTQPGGRPLASAYVGDYLYFGGEATIKEASVGKYIVAGRVVLDKPPVGVQGAALRINDHDIIWTDADGRFFARMTKAKAVHIEVLLSEFMTRGEYVVIDAPTTAKPGEPVTITVARQ